MVLLDQALKHKDDGHEHEDDDFFFYTLLHAITFRCTSCMQNQENRRRDVP